MRRKWVRGGVLAVSHYVKKMTRFKLGIDTASSNEVISLPLQDSTTFPSCTSRPADATDHDD